jgi:hypothetical protein
MTQITAAALNARNRLFTLFCVLCLLDITLVILSRDKWSIIRIVPTIGVMYFVLEGKKWAKWVLVGICSLLVVLLIAMVLALKAKLSTVLIVGSLIMAALSAAIAIYLISSKDLNRYFLYKRG